MSRTSINSWTPRIALLSVAIMLGACANVPKMAEPGTTEKRGETAVVSSKKSTRAILEQPNFEISEKTAAAYNAALRHMRGKNYDTAILEMHEVSRMDGRISGPWVNIGVAHKELGDVEKARAAFQKALSINPKNPFALNEMGILNRKDGKFGQAEKFYMQALSTYPDYENAHLNLAILCDLYLRKIDCALNHYQEYLDLSGGRDKQVNTWLLQLKNKEAR